jgi:hypothetical protein
MRRWVAKETPLNTWKNENTGKGRPPPIILTSEANLISLQREQKMLVSREFFRNTATTKSMVDYNTVQMFLTEKNLHFFTFYTKVGKSVKTVIRHLPGNTYAEDISMASQEIDKTDDSQMSHCRRVGGSHTPPS